MVMEILEDLFLLSMALWEDTTSSLYVQSACYKLLLGPHVVMISLSKLIMYISLVTEFRPSSASIFGLGSCVLDLT